MAREEELPLLQPVREAAGFELLPHTADLRAVVRGADREALYANALGLVRYLLVGESEVRPRARRRLELEAANEAEHFFRFVRELLFLYDTESFLPARVETLAGPVVRGEPLDAARHTSERQIKAVTRHGFRLVREPGQYRAELVFDV